MRRANPVKLRGITATGVCVPAAGVGVTVPAGIAYADPSNGHTATYSFTQCVDSTGRSVADFEAVKQFGQAAALHLLDGRGNFVAMAAVVLGDQTVSGTFYADGTVLFQTPGFVGTNGLRTITCTNTSPVSGIRSRVTGYVAPT